MVKENTVEYQSGIILEVVIFSPDLHKRTFEYKSKPDFINIKEFTKLMDFLNTLHGSRFSLVSVFRCNVLNNGSDPMQCPVCCFS